MSAYVAAHVTVPFLERCVDHPDPLPFAGRCVVASTASSIHVAM